jgi:hypothetical protein
VSPQFSPQVSPQFSPQVSPQFSPQASPATASVLFSQLSPGGQVSIAASQASGMTAGQVSQQLQASGVDLGQLSQISQASPFSLSQASSPTDGSYIRAFGVDTGHDVAGWELYDGQTKAGTLILGVNDRVGILVEATNIFPALLSDVASKFDFGQLDKAIGSFPMHPM